MKQSISVPPLYQQKNAPGKMLWKRKGIIGWWFNLTAPPRPAEMSSLQVREFIRKGETNSLIAIATAAFLVAIVFNSLSDPSTAGASIVMAVAIVIALCLNRRGKVTVAAYILIGMMMASLMGALLGAKGGLRLIWFPTFDLFALPVFISPLIISRRAVIPCTLISIAFVLLYYTYEPHALLNGYGAHNFDEMLYEVNQPYFSWYALINRDIAMILFAGFFGWIAASTFTWALEWGDQATNEANLATAVALYKEQSAQDLSRFVQEITQAFAALGNGQVQFLRPRASTDPLHDAVVFLNGQLRIVEAARKRQRDMYTELALSDLQRLLRLFDQVKGGVIPIRVLNPGQGHFLSFYEEINGVARCLYELLVAYTRLTSQGARQCRGTTSPPSAHQER